MPTVKTPWFIRYANSHPVDEIITANNQGSPYMHRWCLIPKNKYFNIYLHHFIGPDQRVMHDHPWISLAYQLRGYFDEVYVLPSWLRKYGPHYCSERRIHKGEWTYRSAKFLHYLTPGPDGTWSIFMTGPTIKKWGFLTDDGWKPWREVVPNINPLERRDS